MKNIAFIGNGKSTHRYHLPFVEDSKLFNVVGIYARSKNQFEMPYPKTYKIYSDLEEMLQNDIDLVVITTTNSSHFEYAKLVLERGINCIVEKPIVSTTEELMHLYKIAKDNNAFLLPYQNRRYDSDFLTIKQILDNEDLYGEIIEVESNHTYFRDYGNSDSNIFNGMIYNHAVHFIDQIVSVYGSPDKIISDTESQRIHFIEKISKDVAEDYYDIKLIYGKKHIRVRFSPLIHKDPPRWIVHTTKYSFEKYKIDEQERDLKVGIYPDNENFGACDTKVECYANNVLQDISVPIVSKKYTQFYIDLYNFMESIGNIPVSEKDALATLSILELIVCKKN